jgi:carbamoyltransferase
MYILGISCFYHDAAACLLKDGEIIAAAQEERFTRIRHDQDFPTQAIKYCLKEAGITIDQVDYVGFYDKPLIKFERILATSPWRARSVFHQDTPLAAQEAFDPQLIRRSLATRAVLMIEHHMSHKQPS